ncbi:hypothetical protein AMATHDRAFT_76387 [Amanita thiersii Skay4041]|uniref:P-loop containing nucleoside triphosphate hydrolase protein n=1 Tax=Amanita thiersii Skay4041 TaxID=703135 RepID=A0A2A9NMY0_9AGAR|nr:hypothetical protein AMATHDRAFT_76387 [Amanita thiersii Skay4041]
MKRKATSDTAKSTNEKKGKSKKAKAKTDSSTEEWPEHFHSALNTVLAFVSSKRQLATTFSVVRSSVEGLLKRFVCPNVCSADIGNLRALLPDLITFSYVPRHRSHINEPLSSRRDDFSEYSRYCSSVAQDEDEHVLVLTFAENLKGKKSANPGLPYLTYPSMSPSAVKKLVEKRNEIFQQAVNELIQAASDEDPVALLKHAGEDHIPVDPNASKRCGKQYDMSTPSPEERPSIASILDEITELTWYKDQIVDRRSQEASPGSTGQVSPPLPDAVAQALLESRNVVSLYSHQVSAIQNINAGRNVIVSTSTASGKSVIYQVPLLCSLKDDPNAKAIFVYPTKALAQDQKASLQNIIKCCAGLEKVVVSTYDGDTPQESRSTIRESASVIFTNFDMLHASILPHEETWRSFFKSVKLFVVDELHYYSGLLGSHVAQIIRRFRRLCAAVGNCSVRFVSCSATISNPLSHMRDLFGISEDEIEVITEDGAPKGPKEFVIWSPPLVNPSEPSLGRRSSLAEATKLMMFLMKRGMRVIMFCKIRKVCELAMKTLLADLSNEGRYDILERVKPYRGGKRSHDFTPHQERRQIEQEAFSNNLLGLVATNALELGVDIGVLDAVIMLGEPVSIASYRQQAGRVGRRSRDSLAVLVPDGGCDQESAQRSHEFYNRTPEDLLIDVNSMIILEGHLQCAAFEMPLCLDDMQYFGPLLQEVCQTKLRKDEDGWYHPHPNYLPYPSKHISIRGAQEEKYAVVVVPDTGKSKGSARILEEVEVSRALFELYEGGVFMHQGRTFIVREISHDARIAKVYQVAVDWITTPRNVDAIQTHRIREFTSAPRPVRAFYGSTNKTILEAVDVDTPTWERETTGFWIDVPKSVLDLMLAKNINAAEAIHAAQHALLNYYPLAQDVKTECKASKKEYKTTPSQRMRPARLIFYDAIGKSGGIAAKAFDNGELHCLDWCSQLITYLVRVLLEKACTAVEGCHCLQGCHFCVESLACRELEPLAQDSVFNTIVEAPAVQGTESAQVEVEAVL